jgi:hypothetical protein
MLIENIADTKWIFYAYPSRFNNVKLKNQREASHENLASCKNLDRLPRVQLEKKYGPLPPVGT